VEIISFEDIWKHMTGELEKQQDLGTLIANLVAAKKIQTIKGRGLLPVRQMEPEEVEGLIDFSIITDEERSMRR
jgi:hypothetical protein